MTAIAKTKKLVRKDVPIGQLFKNDKNPNKMSDREFNLLCDNIEKTGITDPILVRPAQRHDGTDGLRIVGGHHRFDAASFLSFDEVPVTILPDDFDDDQEKFQLVRMNMIHGKTDPAMFFSLYSELAEEYSDEILQDAFGFAEEAEFQKLIAQSAEAFDDPAMKKKFKEAAKEVKTIDGLSKLLNEMFTKYGDTLPYGYMVVDYGGQKSIWLQVKNPTMKALELISELCIEQKRTMDDIVGYMLREAAKGNLSELLLEAIEKTEEVDIPSGFMVNPTIDNLTKAADVDAD